MIYCPPCTRYSIHLEEGVIAEPEMLPVLKELSILEDKKERIQTAYIRQQISYEILNGLCNCTESVLSMIKMEVGIS